MLVFKEKNILKIWDKNRHIFKPFSICFSGPKEFSKRNKKVWKELLELHGQLITHARAKMFVFWWNHQNIHISVLSNWVKRNFSVTNLKFSICFVFLRPSAFLNRLISVIFHVVKMSKEIFAKTGWLKSQKWKFPLTFQWKKSSRPFWQKFSLIFQCKKSRRTRLDFGWGFLNKMCLRPYPDGIFSEGGGYIKLGGIQFVSLSFFCSA